MYDSSSSQTLLLSQIWDMFWVACGRFMWFRCSQRCSQMLCLSWQQAEDSDILGPTPICAWGNPYPLNICTWKAQCRDTNKGWYNHHQHHYRVSYSGKLGIPTSTRNKTNYESPTVSTAAWVAAEGSISTAGINNSPNQGFLMTVPKREVLSEP